MKIMAFSDLHLSRHRAEVLVEAAVDADLVIGAGDFCNMREGLWGAMSLLSGISCPFLMVPGNAESDTELQEAAPANATVLHGTSTMIEGLTILGIGGGIPPTPFGDWSFDLDEDEAATLLEPHKTCDILISHSPPKGVADLTSTGISVGSAAVRDFIAQRQPGLAMCGHIHDSWGVTGRIGETHVQNLGPTPNWFDL